MFRCQRSTTLTEPRIKNSSPPFLPQFTCMYTQTTAAQSCQTMHDCMTISAGDLDGRITTAAPRFLHFYMFFQAFVRARARMEVFPRMRDRQSQVRERAKRKEEVQFQRRRILLPKKVFPAKKGSVDLPPVLFFCPGIFSVAKKGNRVATSRHRSSRSRSE